MLQTRYRDFLGDSKSRAMYQKAITLLKNAGVDHIMIELSMRDIVDARNPEADAIASRSYFESLGYQRALSDMFDLEAVGESIQQLLEPTFATGEESE